MDVVFEPRFEGWRLHARAMLAAGHAPENVNWIERRPGAVTALFEEATGTSAAAGGVSEAARVPRDFLRLARSVAAHRDPSRWALLYRLLWRLCRESRHLLDLSVDEDVRRARSMAGQVGRDIHKMHAFVRFRRTAAGVYVAWHVPDHHIVRLATPFFARRFAAMRWRILTPDECAAWDGRELRFAPGCDVKDAPLDADGIEDLWRTYYGSTFNPARIKVAMMKREMPVRHWPTLPETADIPALLADAPRRVAEMNALQPTSAAAFVPVTDDLAALARAAASCRGCRLCQSATQVVFGRGPARAAIALVGEQPGDQEDRSGEPFVGPAGRVLDEALSQAGLERQALYLTNAVKHFKFEADGEMRLHKRPHSQEVAACMPWLVAELGIIKPRLLVCLGVTAAQAVLGRAVNMRVERGVWQASRFTPHTLVTLHPAAVLRAGDEARQAAALAQLVADLALVAERSLRLALDPA